MLPRIPKLIFSVILIFVFRSNLLKLEYIVLQAPIVRVFIVFGQVIAVAEQREHALWWLHLFDLVSLASLLLAIFGIHTLARVTSVCVFNLLFEKVRY